MVRCIASCWPRNRVSVEVSYTPALVLLSHPSVWKCHCEKESEVRSDKDSQEEEETYLSPMMAFSTSQSSRHAPWEMMASETWQFCTLAGGRNLGEVKMGLRAS